MKLTLKEKERIFFVLLEDFFKHERTREHARQMFNNKPEKLRQAFGEVNAVARQSYALIKKFANEIGREMPDYTEPNETN